MSTFAYRDLVSESLFLLYIMRFTEVRSPWTMLNECTIYDYPGLAIGGKLLLYGAYNM